MDTRRKTSAIGSRLDQARILERALHLADAEGLESLSIRRLARELGVTPMALYWHFRDKEALLTGLADRIYAEMAFAYDPSRPWLVALEGLLTSLTRVLRAHPSSASLFSTRMLSPTETFSSSSLRGSELMLELLRQGGFSPAEATQVARHMLDTVTGLVAVAEGAAAQGPAETVKERTRAFLEALPPATYPRLVEAAGPLSTVDDADRYYRFGLELLLAGVETMAARLRASGS